MSPWILFTVLAAAMQTLRFILQKQLGGAGLSTAGATFARFLYAAPIAIAITGATLAATGADVPQTSVRFWAFVLAGGIAQIIATDLTVRLFQARNFAVGVAFTKTETLLVAVFSAVVLGETVGTLGWLAIALGLLGVLFISRSPEPGAPLVGRAAVMGLAAGALFGVAAVGYRGATLALEPAPYFVRSSAALAAATSLQTILMMIWLAWREPGEIVRVLTGWRRTALVGLTGMLGSLGWFTAFSLMNAAYVRALGQVEMVFTLCASVFLFGERLKTREGVGIALVVLSFVAIVLLH